MKTYNESWATLWPDMQEIWLEQHRHETPPEEVRNCADCQIDVLKYMSLDSSGLLDITTIRDTDNKLIGYSINLITPHINYADVICNIPMLHYIRKEYRGQGLGKLLITATEQNLRKRGVQAAFMSTKTDLQQAGIYTKLGWRHHELFMFKWLGD